MKKNFAIGFAVIMLIYFILGAVSAELSGRIIPLVVLLENAFTNAIVSVIVALAALGVSSIFSAVKSELYKEDSK